MKYLNPVGNAPRSLRNKITTDFIRETKKNIFVQMTATNGF